MFALADAHIHLFRNGFAGRYGRSPAGLGREVDVYETLRREHDIAAALVVGYEGDGIDPSNNTYLREAAATRSWMTTLAHVPAGESPREADVERLLAAGHRGIALFLMEAASAPAVSQWPSAVWKPLEDCRAIVSVNAVAACLPAVEAMARRYGGCAFMISHLGDPGSHADVPSRAGAAALLAPLLALAELPNVHVKISGLYAVADAPHRYPHPQATPFVELILDSFGPTRCLWGSDFSPSLDFISFEQALDPVQLAGLDEADRGLVMGANLLGLLGGTQ